MVRPRLAAEVWIEPAMAKFLSSAEDTLAELSPAAGWMLTSRKGMQDLFRRGTPARGERNSFRPSVFCR